VSISSLQSNNWFPPYQSQSYQTNPGAPLTGSIPQTQSNPFQQLAAGVQAVLAQGQSATAGPATDPAQQLATALQSLYAQSQATQSNGDPGVQSPTTGQANATEPPHHHRAADATSSSGTASTSPTAASGNTQTLTADMMRALQAYASSSSATSSIGLTI
jgi:hypothetical protein